MDPSTIRDPTWKKELLKELTRLTELRREWLVMNGATQATVLRFPSKSNRLEADSKEATLRMIDGFIAAIEIELVAYEASAHVHRAQSSEPIPLGPPASSGVVPVAVDASASQPRELPPGPVPTGPVRRGASAPNPIPRASGMRRKDPMTIPFVGWTLSRPSRRTLALFIGGITAVASVVLLLALFGGKFNSPAIDPTVKSPIVATNPGGTSGGGQTMPGYVVDPTTCEIKDDVTGEVIGSADNCTPVSAALPSRQPLPVASPGLDDNDVVEQPGECGVIHEYPLEGLPEVATSGNFIHVEHYDASKPNDPETESVLDHGRYGVNGYLKGYVWEYSIECSRDEVMVKVDALIQARQSAGENNVGLASPEVTDDRFSFIDDNGDPWGSFDPDRANPDSPKCQTMKEYPLAGRSKLSTNGSFIHVEHYVGGEPERESILSGDSNWKVQNGVKGFVWEYSKVCNWGQVRDQVQRHIRARRADHANNAGFIAWDNAAISGRFTQVR